MVYQRSGERGRSSKPKPTNAFANDGSFLEMFKKLQEQQGNQSGSTSTSASGGSGSGNKSLSESSPVTENTSSDVKDSSALDSKQSVAAKPLFVGKRRGGRFLATGKVKKLKAEGQADEEAPPKDAWSLYLAEVKKYKQTTCEEEGKTRPLVK